MKTSFLTFLFSCALAIICKGQFYISYFTGDVTNVETGPVKGVCLMGGAGEHDNAMRWFLENADGGDVLVLRTDDSDGYNDYMFSDLGVDVNSVETIVCNSALASSDPYVIDQVKNAEAIWFAGGDQWDYISYWRDTEVEEALNYCINTKGITIGGISAGMAIMGEYYFTAENGTITSLQALNNPYSNLMKLGYGDFLENPLMENIITDTHFDNPDRRGRTTAFLARIFTENGYPPYAVACNEYTSICIDENKIAHVFGEYPEYDDIVYFIQVNCIKENTPEICEDDVELTWDRDDAALKVISMYATNEGEGTFDLNDWITINPAGPYSWENWWAESGEFNFQQETAPINCDDTVVSLLHLPDEGIEISPNPVHSNINIQLPQAFAETTLSIIDIHGRLMIKQNASGKYITMDATQLSPGMYLIRAESGGRKLSSCFLKE
ncbi:MAG: T9SS type A sorting domain-containing protein [Chitinophagales bacterium]